MNAFAVDRQKTKDINKDSLISICNCCDCQYFYKYMDFLSRAGCDFFEKNGIKPLHIQELWAYYPNDNGISHCCGYFNIVLCDHSESEGYIITDRWSSLRYGHVIIRYRYEHLSDNRTIMGFECDLPIDDSITNVNTKQ